MERQKPLIEIQECVCTHDKKYHFLNIGRCDMCGCTEYIQKEHEEHK